MAATAQVIEFGDPAPPLPEVVDRSESDDASLINGETSTSPRRRAGYTARPAAEQNLDSREKTAFAFASKAAVPPMVELERVWIESGVLTENHSQADTSNYFRGDLAAEWALSNDWSLRLAGRVDGVLQTGADEFNSLRLDYGESYLRYQDQTRRITLGAQIVSWGRVDESAPTNRLSVQDISRLLLDDLEDRRRAVMMARWEEFIGEFKLDLQYIPHFRAAETPRLDSIWSPVNKHTGELIGMPFNPLLATLVKGGDFDQGGDGDGGWGVRLSRPGRAFDYAVTVQQARQSLPYFALDPLVRAKLLTDPGDIGAALRAAPDTFEAQYPRTWVVGGDLGLVTDRATWRVEAAWLSDQSATTTDLRYITLEAIDWVAGVEVYPGDRELRVNLQLGGSQLLDAPSRLLDRQNTLNLFGDIENAFGRDRWRARLRFFAGLDDRDLYLNPKIAFVGWEPHELYLAYHYFDGAEQTLGGFFQQNALVTLGLRSQF
ncbi:MAG: hypothetical protein GVY22_11015 [Gammaproteobacteria bacterium]|jgi:hypothetical protein|nr:hypothetical protein [Gammaproteobacteria bacterium]